MQSLAARQIDLPKAFGHKPKQKLQVDKVNKDRPAKAAAQGKKAQPYKPKTKAPQREGSDALCVANLLSHYGAHQQISCEVPCKYPHYNAISKGVTKATVIKKVHFLAPRLQLEEGIGVFLKSRLQDGQRVLGLLEVPLTSTPVSVAHRPPQPTSRQQPTEQDRMRQGTLKARERLRINSLKILQIDKTDDRITAAAKIAVDAFTSAIGASDSISEELILDTLQRAHVASDDFTLNHAKAWNTTFEFPPEALVSDRDFWHSCGKDFTLMCKTKQDRLTANKLSTERLKVVFGPTGTKVPGLLPTDFQLLLEFATVGITPIVVDDFVPE